MRITGPAIAFFLFSVSTSAQDAPRFPGAQYPMGGNPYGLALGDLNGDGVLDAVTAERFSPGSITVALGDGTGRFGAPTSTPVGDSPEYLIAGHFDLDAHLDVVTANEDSDDVTLLHGDGTGGFGAVQHLAVGGTPSSVDAADLNGDGYADLVTASQVSPTSAGFSVLLSDGLGGYGAASTYPVPGIIGNHVQLAHANADAHLDIVHAFFGGTITVALGDGSGGFGAAVNYPTGSFGDDWLDVADFDEDGFNDIVSAGVVSGTPVLNVLFGDGTGAFAAPVTFPTGPNPLYGRAVDLDGDAHTDVVVLAGDWTISVHYGDGAGGFAAPVELAGGYTQEYVAAGDLDANGALDLVVSNRNTNTIGAYLAESPGAFVTAQLSGGAPQAFALGDLDGDGTLDAATGGTAGVELWLGDGLGSFTSAGAPLSVGPTFWAVELADLDTDGHADVVALMGADPPAVGVWPGDGAGSIAVGAQTPVELGPRDLAVGDFDGDGLRDVAVANAAQDIFVILESSVSVLLGDGAGGLGVPVTTDVNGLPTAVAAADLDGDGLGDLAVGVNGGGAVLFGDGTGGFPAAPLELALGGAGVDVAAGDANLDGELDLFYANTTIFGGGTFTLLTGDGTGGFGVTSSIAIDDTVNSLAVGDLDGDGLLDVTVTGQSLLGMVLIGDGAGGFTQSEIYGSGAAARVADVDGDGRADWVSRRSALSVHLNQVDAPAGSAPFGTGTPGCLGTSGLLGNSVASVGSPAFGLIGTNAPPSAPGFLFLTLGSNPAGLLLNDVLFHLDLVSSPFLLFLNMASDAGGTAFAPLPIPADPSLGNLTITAQVLWSWSSKDVCEPSFFGLASSVGLELTIAP